MVKIITGIIFMLTMYSGNAYAEATCTGSKVGSTGHQRYQAPQSAWNVCQAALSGTECAGYTPCNANYYSSDESRYTRKRQSSGNNYTYNHYYYKNDNTGDCPADQEKDANGTCKPIPPNPCTDGETHASMYTESEYAAYSQGANVVDAMGCRSYFSGSPTLYNDADGNTWVGIDTIQTGEVGTGDEGEASATPDDEVPDIGDISGSTIPDISLNDSQWSDSAPFTDANGDYVEENTATSTDSTEGGTDVSSDGTTTTVTKNPDGTSTTKTTTTETRTHPDGSSTVTTTTTSDTTTGDVDVSTYGPDGGYSNTGIPGGTVTDGTKTQTDTFDSDGKPTSSQTQTEGRDPDEEPEEEDEPEETVLSEAPTDGDSIEAHLGRLMAGIYESEVYTAVSGASLGGGSGSCPTFDIPIFETSLSTTNHCQLWDQISAILGYVFLAGWSVLGLKIVMSA